MIADLPEAMNHRNMECTSVLVDVAILRHSLNFIWPKNKNGVMPSF